MVSLVGERDGNVSLEKGETFVRHERLELLYKLRGKTTAVITL